MCPLCQWLQQHLQRITTIHRNVHSQHYKITMKSKLRILGLHAFSQAQLSGQMTNILGSEWFTDWYPAHSPGSIHLCICQLNLSILLNIWPVSSLACVISLSTKITIGRDLWTHNTGFLHWVNFSIWCLNWQTSFLIKVWGWRATIILLLNVTQHVQKFLLVCWHIYPNPRSPAGLLRPLLFKCTKAREIVAREAHLLLVCTVSRLWTTLSYVTSFS